jgi:hypothetical protein
MNWFRARPPAKPANTPPTPPDTPPSLPALPVFGNLFDPHYEELEKREITEQTSAGAK